MSYKSEIRILDVGSGNQRFSGGLDDIQNKFIIGFEPDKRTFDSARPLGDSNKENGIVYPFALAGANGSRKLNLTRIESTTFIDNYPSKRVCEKIGLRFEGIRKKGYMLYNGTIHDVLAFGITDEEYFEKYGKEDNKVVYLYE